MVEYRAPGRDIHADVFFLDGILLQTLPLCSQSTYDSLRFTGPVFGSKGKCHDMQGCMDGT